MPFPEKSKQALALAYSMKQKAEGKSGGGVCHACGGKMAHGGLVGGWKEKEDLENVPDGGSSQLAQDDDDDDEVGLDALHLSEGGAVDDSSMESVEEADGDSDDLVYSPEVESGSVENEEDPEDDSKRSGFLRAYLINRKMRG